MAWKPEFPGEWPTLGWTMLDWYTDMLAQPDCADYQPLVLTDEQAKFVLDYYRLDPRTGRRVVRRGVLSRSKGWGKSPIVGAIGAGEGLGPVVFDGWDANGRPVGRPWNTVRTPRVQFAALNEDQTKNAFEPMLEMLREGPVMDYYDIDPMETFVALPKGRIEFITAAALSKEGEKPVFAALDQTEGWVRSNGGKNLASVIRRNAGKIGGSTLETPNSYRPGTGSVSEETFAYAQAIEEGRARTGGLLVDHREAPASTDMSDDESLYQGLLVAYGDSARENGGWVDLRRIMDEVRDPATDPQDARQYYLNQVTHASDSWVSKPEIMAAVDLNKHPAPGDVITLGFDGSRGRNKGKADATALVGMRVRDKHLFTIGVWEPREGDPQDWTPNISEVDAVVRETKEKFNVVGFYADPSGWTGQVAEWEALFASTLKVKASRDAPISAWPRGKDTRVADHVEMLRLALVSGEMTWDGSSALMRHMLNARRRALRRGGYLLYKQFPDSPDKIDAAYAGIMAYKACLDFISSGKSAKPVNGPRRRRKAVLA